MGSYGRQTENLIKIIERILKSGNRKILKLEIPGTNYRYCIVSMDFVWFNDWNDHLFWIYRKT